MRGWVLCLAAAALAICLAWPGAADAAGKAFPEVMFILDASGSMWGQAGDQARSSRGSRTMKVVPLAELSRSSFPPWVSTTAR